jgi:hypothetical protein
MDGGKESIRMNAAVEEIWTELGAEPDPGAHGFAELTEVAQLEGETYLRATAPLLRWLRVGHSAGHRRPSAAFYEALFSRGRAACEMVLNRYLEEASDPREGITLWRALAPAARLAKNRGCISWDLDSWRPGGDDESKVRLLGRVSQGVDERTRALAFATKRSLSDILAAALTEYADRFEKKNGPLPKRSEAAQAVAS